MSTARPELSDADQKKAISTVLTNLRKKDLSGLLRAQRNGTLDEYLSPHLDAYIAKRFGSGTSPANGTVENGHTADTTESTNESGTSDVSNGSAMKKFDVASKSDAMPSTSTASAIPSTSKSVSPRPMSAYEKHLEEQKSRSVSPSAPKSFSPVPMSRSPPPSASTVQADINGARDDDVEDVDETGNRTNDTLFGYKPHIARERAEERPSTDVGRGPLSYSTAKGRRMSQLAGTAMEEGCDVWAKPSATDDWVKATVRSIMAAPQPRGRNSMRKYSKFLLDVEDGSGGYGGELEVVSAPVEGSLEEYEFVKLRNHVDDDDETVEALEDLITLSYLHEPSILCCLKKRFERNLIYTNTGPILIAVNPFKNLSIYSEESVALYRDAGAMAKFNSDIVKRPPPHVFQIADDAYRSMVEHSLANVTRIAAAGAVSESNMQLQNQSILVSGESGAGKTETTKFIMRYLADITAQNTPADTTDAEAHSIESQVLQSNPILECFGNARTLRNDNSSRFGKFIEINFCRRGRDDITFRITGATIRTYLLEKVRLVRQAVGERNYHCFYEIMKGSSQDELDVLGLTSLWDFHYTNQSEMVDRLDGVDDAAQYKITRRAMSVLGFTEEEQQKVLQVSAAVLHAGNIVFDVKPGGTSGEDDGSKVSLSCWHHMQTCCALLELDEEALEKTLCVKIIKTPGKVYEKMVSVEEAEYARDAFAKTIYGALFDWLVQRVNRTIARDQESSKDAPPSAILTRRLSSKGAIESRMRSAFIGVLDIFGFENFEINSFEQLCINYTNETLQQHFNQFVFKHEQALYEKEGISWSFIRFPDNSDVLDLLENKRSGLFALCDEQLRFPKATDKTLCHKFYEKCDSHKRFFAGSKEKADDIFVVKHFAGPVRYSTVSFLEKNHDVVRPDTAHLVRSSNCWLVSGLADFFRIEEESSGAGIGGGRLQPSMTPGDKTVSRNVSSRSLSRTPSSIQKAGHNKIQTLSGEFRSQLEELMNNINTTSPHYIRCLKPNTLNIGDEFDAPLVVGQLRCGGVLEAVRVSRAGYPKRMTAESFVKCYEFYGWKERPSSSNNMHQLAGALCNKIADNALANPQFVPSEDALGQTDKFMLAGIQHGKTMVFMRSRTFDFLEREKLLYHRRLATNIQKEFRRYSAMTMYRHVQHGVRLIQCTVRTYLAISRTKRIRRYNAAVLIQRTVRGLKARRFARMVLNGIKRIQACKRGYDTRERTRDLRVQYKAAVRVQCMVRRKLARVLLKNLKVEARSLAKVMREKEELAQKLAEAANKFELERQELLVGTESKMTELQEDLSKALEELKRTTDRVATLEEEGRMKDDDLKALEEEFEEYRSSSKNSDYVDAMQIELDTCRSDVMTFRDRAAVYQLQVSALKRDIQGLEQDLEEAQNAASQCDELMEQIAEKETQVQSLENATENLIEQIKDSKSESSEHMQQIKKLEQAVQTLIDEAEAARADGGEARSEAAELRDTVKTLRDQLENAERDHTKQIHALEQKNQEMLKDLAAVRAEGGDSSKQVQTLESAVQSLIDELEDAKAEKDTQQRLAKDLETETKKLIAERDAAKNKASESTRALDALDKKYKALLDEVKTANSTGDMSKQTALLEVAVSELEDKLKQTRSVNSDLEAKVAQLENELRNQKNVSRLASESGENIELTTKALDKHTSNQRSTKPRDSTRSNVSAELLNAAMQALQDDGNSDDDDRSGVTSLTVEKHVTDDSDLIQGLRDDLGVSNKKCMDLEEQLEDSQLEVRSLKRVKDGLQRELQNVTEELTKSKAQVLALQERLSKANIDGKPNGVHDTQGSSAWVEEGIVRELESFDGNGDRNPPGVSRPRVLPKSSNSFGHTDPPMESEDDGVGTLGAGQWGFEGSSMQRRISYAFSNKLSSLDGCKGGMSIDDASSVGPNGSIYREKDTIMCKRLSDWLMKAAGIVPSRAASYAVVLVQNGQGTIKRLKKVLRRDEDFLLSLGFDDDDAEEIADALMDEDPVWDYGDNKAASAPQHSMPMGMGMYPPGVGMSMPMNTHGPGMGMSGASRGSLSPVFPGFSNQRPFVRMSSNASLRSGISMGGAGADMFSDAGVSTSSGDKAVREARLARLENQAHRAAVLAQEASEEADRVSKEYRSIKRRDSGGSKHSRKTPSRSPVRSPSKSPAAMGKAIAEAHEKAFLAAARARDAAFLSAAESSVARDSS